MCPGRASANGQDVDQGNAFEEAEHTFTIKSQVRAEEERQVSATPSVYRRGDRELVHAHCEHLPKHFGSSWGEKPAPARAIPGQEHARGREHLFLPHCLNWCSSAEGILSLKP